MIRTLTGRPLYTFEEGVVLDVNGVGYEVFVNSTTAQKLVESGQTTIHIYTHVRDDALLLFGFSSIEERRLFTQLLGVSGVGPKSALHICGRGVFAVTAAVRGSDVAFFQAVPRLGKKTAQKIIVELQPKFGADSEFSLSPLDSVAHDVREALLGLGYDERSIQSVVSNVDESQPLDQAIKRALKHLGGR